MSAGCDVIMWRRPAMAVLVLACGTLIYYHCAVRNRNIVALISDVLFVISWSLALLGLIFRFLNLKILPVDPSGWQVSVESANYVAAMLANTLGATEGVLRIAAVGSDFKLFLKVVLALYLLSAIGRSASGATVVYATLWFIFIVPFSVKMIAPKIKTPAFLVNAAKSQGTEAVGLEFS
ncbi:hypothetical protein BDL97_02G013300 [Sphagnum fallax]|nr:hypothetical protein BDL97_02G013300 [Sphagnum fallax]